jgi:integrase
MLNLAELTKKPIKYHVYNVTRLKDKYGYKIKFEYADDTIRIHQFGGFKKKSEAKEARDNAVADIKNNKFVYYGNIKFKDFAIAWLEQISKPNIAYNSYMSYRNVIKNYAIPFFKEMYLTTINIGHITNFYNKATDKSSVLRIIKYVLGIMFQYTKENNLTRVNPTIGVKIQKNEEEKQYGVLNIDTSKTLTIEQTKILIEASKSTPIYLEILFALLTGLRKSEIHGLKYTDIDWSKKKIYITRQLGVDPNKNKEECKKKTITKQEIKLKTRSSKREIDIPDMLYEALLEERIKYEKNKRRRINDKTNLFIDENYICCSTYGHSRSRGFVRPYFIKLLEDNNLPKIRFHDLRHTYTTLILMNNGSLKAVSTLLGHSSTMITLNNYFNVHDIVIDCTNFLNSIIAKTYHKKDTKIEIIDLNLNLLIKREVP